jgi:hypothetical protein
VPLGLWLVAPVHEVRGELQDSVLFQAVPEVLVREGCMGILKEGEGRPVRRPVLPPIQEDHLQEPDDVFLKHDEFNEVLILHIACEIQNDSNHQVAVSVEQHFIRGSSRYLPRYASFQLLNHDLIQTPLLHHLGHPLYAVLVRREIKQYGSPGVLDSGYLTLFWYLNEAFYKLHDFRQVPA